MRTDSFLGINPVGFHRVVYREWGSPENRRVLVCVHGLARNSRDFDEVARALSRDYRVICPDVVGRGESDWLPPGCPYELNQYLSDMTALLARLDVDQVDWLGTSMGGMIGMALAARSHTPIRHLVLNDIGAFVSREALQRIGTYVGTAPLFEDCRQVEDYLRATYPAYAGISDDQWRQLARHGSRKNEQGQLALAYDPVIGDYTRAGSEADIDLWPLWSQITCPQLLFWGEQSDVLTRDTVERMQAHRPGQLTVSAWPDVGHPPSLMVPEQIHVLVDWLRANRAG